MHALSRTIAIALMMCILSQSSTADEIARYRIYRSKCVGVDFLYNYLRVDYTTAERLCAEHGPNYVFLQASVTSAKCLYGLTGSSWFNSTHIAYANGPEQLAVKPAETSTNYFMCHKKYITYNCPNAGTLVFDPDRPTATKKDALSFCKGLGMDLPPQENAAIKTVEANCAIAFGRSLQSKCKSKAQGNCDHVHTNFLPYGIAGGFYISEGSFLFVCYKP